VKARLTQNWSRTPVLYPNEGPGQPPADGGPYLAVQYPISRARAISVGAPGANLHRSEGTIRFVLGAPAGGGTDPYGGWLEELRSLFRSKIFDGVETLAPSEMATDDRDLQGGYCFLSFSVPYKLNTFG
jgi:hypothetical protein